MRRQGPSGAVGGILLHGGESCARNTHRSMIDTQEGAEFGNGSGTISSTLGEQARATGVGAAFGSVAATMAILGTPSSGYVAPHPGREAAVLVGGMTLAGAASYAVAARLRDDPSTISAKKGLGAVTGAAIGAATMTAATLVSGAPRSALTIGVSLLGGAVIGALTGVMSGSMAAPAA